MSGAHARMRAVAGPVRFLQAVILTIALLAAGCTSEPGARGSGSGAATSGDALDAITRAGERGVDETLGIINRLAYSAADDLRSAALEHLADEDASVRWAALYALSVSVTPDDREATDALRGFLDDPDPATRLTAAGSLLSIGDKAAVPALIDLLSADAPLPSTHPPMRVWGVARTLLLAHVGQDLGLLEARDLDAVAAAQDPWRTWWDANGASLTWDPGTLRFLA